MRCTKSLRPNHRISSRSESWTLAGYEINFKLVVATVIGINSCLLLMLAKLTKIDITLAISLCKGFFNF